MGEVVWEAFPTSAEPSEAKADGEVVAELESLLNMARAGELQGFSLVGVTDDLTIYRTRAGSGVPITSLLAGISAEHSYLLTVFNQPAGQ